MRLKPSCFIATAAYGTSVAQELYVLRAFRDHVLRRQPAGRLLVAWYSHASPPMARVIADHPSLRAMVRMALRPVIAVARWWLSVEERR